MKKIYSIPSMEIVKLTKPEIMAGSTLSTNNTPISNAASDARGGWFDEDEE